MKVSINDKLINDSETQIGIYNLGLNRGYAVFDYFKIVDGKFRFFEDHLDRFLRSIRLSNIPCSYSRDQIIEKIIGLKEVNRVINGSVRIILTAGDSNDFISIPSESYLIIVVGHSSPTENTKTGVNLISKYYQRSVPEIKTTDYFFAQMHRSEMLKADAVDILYYTDWITETSRANIFFVKNKKLFTPKSNILEGITRKKILNIYRGANIEDISLDQIPEFDEAFMCSSTREITPVLKIDNITIGMGKTGSMVSEIIETFKAISL